MGSLLINKHSATATREKWEFKNSILLFATTLTSWFGYLSSTAGISKQSMASINSKVMIITSFISVSLEILYYMPTFEFRILVL